MLNATDALTTQLAMRRDNFVEMNPIVSRGMDIGGPAFLWAFKAGILGVQWTDFRWQSAMSREETPFMMALVGAFATLNNVAQLLAH